MLSMTPWVTRLLVANVVMAVVTGQLVGPVLGRLGRDIYMLLMLYPPDVLFRPWTVLTYMFLHAGAAHLLFNMIGLLFFGPRLESRLGSKAFLLLYVVSGLGGAGFSLIFAREAPVVGASGAVYGVLLAYAMFWPRAQMIVFPIPVPIEARFVIGAYLALSIVQGVTGAAAGIAHFAHLGGAAFGFAFLRWWEWRKGAARREFQKKMSVESSASGIVGDRVALARWKGISTAGLHELNRGEVERLLDKAERDGPASLTRSERDFLDRMSVK